MISRASTSGIAVCITCALAGCGTPQPRVHSVVDLMVEQEASPKSCEELGGVAIISRVSPRDSHPRVDCVDRFDAVNAASMMIYGRY